MQVENRIEIYWLNQPGRILSRMESIADGFHGSSAIAAAAAVAENSSHDSGYAEKAVAFLRDAFAEGVAYGVEDVFRDAVDEIESLTPDGEYTSFSFAAAAVLGDEVWVCSRGTCRIFLSGAADSTERNYRNVMDLSGKGITSLKLQPGQSVILLTYGLRKLMGSAAALKNASRCRKSLRFCLTEMIRETRIRFRKKGGSAAAVRLCSNTTRINMPRTRYLVYLLAFVLASAAGLILCQNNGERGSQIESDSGSAGEVVMPLN